MRYTPGGNPRDWQFRPDLVLIGTRRRDVPRESHSTVIHEGRGAGLRGFGGGGGIHREVGVEWFSG